MQILRTVAELRQWSREGRKSGKTIGLVPTMGALHAGHASLIRAAAASCDKVAVSVFVNPTQFGPNEDYAVYPRTLEADCALAEAQDADVVFAPSVEELYPAGAATFVEVEGLSSRLDGASRPGHFRGVTTVVSKLLIAAEPDRAKRGTLPAWVSALQIRDVFGGAGLPPPGPTASADAARPQDGVAPYFVGSFRLRTRRESGLAFAPPLATAVRFRWRALLRSSAIGVTGPGSVRSISFAASRAIRSTSACDNPTSPSAKMCKSTAG